MVVKFLVILSMAVVTAFSQGQIKITGVVQNSGTKAPVSAASVKLLGSGIAVLTDTDGKFTIAGTSLNRRLEKTVPVDPKTLIFPHSADGFVKIAVCNLSGRQIAVIHSGALKSGIWQISPPELSQGMYLCTFDTPESHHGVRFLATGKGSGAHNGMLRNSTDHSTISYTALAKHKAAPKPVDSLLVTKNGYKTATVPINDYQQTGLIILLEDSTVAGAENSTIVPDPSWTCYMPDGIPPPHLGTVAFTMTFEYSAVHNVGLTKFGNRRQFDIKSGTIKGERIDGTALSGGLDYELTLSNGSIELEQIIILKAGSTHILMRNAGVAPAGDKRVRMVLDFEAPNSSSYTWLNTGKFAALRIIDSVAKTIKMEVYDISKATNPAQRIQIKDPADVVNQTWECVKISGSQGATVFTESVSLGSSISIGASKRGSRNIIPITGGTMSGKVKGKILSGGADYQLSGLDARYTLAPDDGEFIVVRNCGSGALVPVFEARVEGPYNYLNENKYLSSQPGMSGGGVSITFYEKK